MSLGYIENKLIDRAKKGKWLVFSKEGRLLDFDETAKKDEIKTPDISQIGVVRITIQAEFIRKILLGLIPDLKEPIIGVFIRGAIIKGKLDLRDASSKGFSLPPLRLDDCLILGDEEKRKKDPYDPVIDARHASLQRLTLKRSRIGIIDLRGAKIDRNLDMDSVKPLPLPKVNKYKYPANPHIPSIKFKKPSAPQSNACLIAENATINGNINLRACELRLTIPDDDMETKLEYTDALCLYEAKVAGSLMVYEEKIVDPTTKKVIAYNYPKIYGRVSLSYAEFSKNVWFFSSTIKGDIRNRVEKDQSKKAIVAIGLKCQVFRIGRNTKIEGAHHFPTTGDIDIYYANLKYFHMEDLNLEGVLNLFSINVETDVRLKNINFIENNNVSSRINLINAEINSDLNLEKINCTEVLANNAIIAGRVSVSEFPPRWSVQADWVDNRRGYISYSTAYESRQIDFDNASVGSDFSITECFVGLIKAKNIRVKGDTKFKDTFAQFNIKLANVEGELHFDNEEVTILSHIAMDETDPVRRIIESGIPKITANDLEIAGPIKLNCLEINAEYYGNDATPEIDFSGGIFKGEFRIGDITFRSTFKDSRPVFSLNDAKIEGDIHFEKNKQVRKRLDDFTKFFVDDSRNMNIGLELADLFLDKRYLNTSRNLAWYISNTFDLLNESKGKSALNSFFQERNHCMVESHPYEDKLVEVSSFYMRHYQEPDKEKKIKHAKFNQKAITEDELKEYEKECQQKLDLLNSLFLLPVSKPNKELWKYYKDFRIEEVKEYVEELYRRLPVEKKIHSESDIDYPERIKRIAIEYQGEIAFLEQEIKKRLNDYFSKYAEGWDISKFNHRHIKRYKISCYPQFEYVELVSEVANKEEGSKKKSKNKAIKQVTSFLIHRTDKFYSIHLDRTSRLIHWLNKHEINNEKVLKLETTEQVIDYMKFFCAHINGEAGAFWILDENENLHPIAIRQEDTGEQSQENKIVKWRVCNVSVCFDNIKYLTELEIDIDSGMVNMKDDQRKSECDNFRNIKHHEYANYDDTNPTHHFSIAKLYGWKPIPPWFSGLEHTRYVLLHFMHVNFSLSGLNSNAFKFDVNGDRHNFGCGINLRLDGFEYKRIEDNDDMFKGGFTNESSNTTDRQDTDRQDTDRQAPQFNRITGASSKNTNNGASTQAYNPTYLIQDKYEGIHGVLDKQYDNHKKPTHTGFDSQPYEQMAKVLSASGAYGAAKKTILKKVQHESLAQSWLIKTKHRVYFFRTKKPSKITWFLSTAALIIFLLWSKFADIEPKLLIMTACTFLIVFAVYQMLSEILSFLSDLPNRLVKGVMSTFCDWREKIIIAMPVGCKGWFDKVIFKIDDPRE